MARNKCCLVLFIASVCLFSLFFFIEQAGAQNMPQKEDELGAEKVVSSPGDIKECTAIYVFVGWMWLSILVIVYFLRLKVREVDRLHRLKLFLTKEK